MSNLDERTKTNFLIYANSVIKSRAIPHAEDNLKPVHRRILWSMYENKIYSDKKTVKCAKIYGDVLGKYHPHGDAACYGALVHLSLPWKMRYPLIDFQGSNGNLLGDPYAAGRYTEARLSKIGMLMLDGVNNDAVDMRPNYDETCEEPITLPSRFPYLLCGNNSGIAVGMSSDIVSHNFTEVAAAIKYYLKNKDCAVTDLMKYIKGPDFPTKGVILNGEKLLDIYTTGQGSIKVQAHYEINKKGSETQITFFDLPYGVEITSGIIAPLKKLVNEEGYDCFKDYYAECINAEMQYYNIVITLAKGANVPECLELLFNKTGLCSTIKINQTLIIDGEPKVLNLKQMIEFWVNYRSNIIKRLSNNNYKKTAHKLTVVIGLQKCMSDIDKLISLIRNSDSKADAKLKIQKEFVLNDEQADAVLDMKLSRLSKLDIKELADSQKELEKSLENLNNIIANEDVRYEMIAVDLDEIKGIIGKDDRLTEIIYNQPVEQLNEVAIKKEYIIYEDHIAAVDEMLGGIADGKIKQVLFSYGKERIITYSKEEMCPAVKAGGNNLGAFYLDEKKNKIVSVTRNGYIKISLSSEYKFNKIEKVMKLKEDDELAYVGMVNDDDFVILWDGEHLLKLGVAALPVSSKLTVGVKSGFTSIVSAFAATEADLMLCITSDNKGKYTPIKDLNVDSRGNKGQSLAEGTEIVRFMDSVRENIYLMPKMGKIIVVPASKLSVKSKSAMGATITNRVIVDAR